MARDRNDEGRALRPGPYRSPDVPACGPLNDDELTRLEHGVLKLPRLQRQIYLAICANGMAYEEVAERTGLSQVQVRRQLAKALYRLGRHMRGEPNRPWWWPF